MLFHIWDLQMWDPWDPEEAWTSLLDDEHHQVTTITPADSQPTSQPAPHLGGRGGGSWPECPQSTTSRTEMNRPKFDPENCKMSSFRIICYAAIGN